MNSKNRPWPTPAWNRRLLVLLTAACVGDARAQTPLPAAAPATAPPPAVSEIWKAQRPNGTGETEARSPGFVPASLTAYSIGDPTPDEQLYLELINRARMHPTAEAAVWRNTTNPDVLSAFGYFSVDLNLMVTQIAPLAATQPLSFNAQLLEAARAHTTDMFVNNYQGHIGTDGSNPGLRLNAAGYSWNTYGENAFATARSVLHGHAGFEVDWGPGPGGMQTPPGHRLNIHNGNFREAGIGVTNGLRGSVGPQVVTEEFASRWSLTPFITGVVYYDFNTNNFYDAGEGIGGVRVEVAGATWFAVTANSGGYSVPVPADGTYNVTFSGPNLPATTFPVTVSNGLNAKLDWSPVYLAPLLSGPPTIAVARPTPYTFTPVGGATAYQWKQAKRIAATDIEGAEGGTTNYSAVLSTNYTLVQSAVKASGANAFHLVHPQPVDQILNLSWVLRPATNGQLTFASRLGWATVDQIARLQVNAGGTWEDLWTRAGDNTPGESAFSTIRVSLAAFAGREILVRLIYDHTGGSYYYQTSTGIGWYIDNIACTNCERLVNTQVADVSDTGFSFVPPESANYSLRVRAHVGGGYLDWGPAALASASTSVIVVRITSAPFVANSRAAFTFSVLNGNPTGFTVETATGPFGPWTRDDTASIDTLVAGSQYRATCAANSGRCFYRVVARP